MKKLVVIFGLITLCLSLSTQGEERRVALSGHIKYQPLISTYPEHSIYRNFMDSPAVDNNLDARFNANGQMGAWQWDLNYQLFAKSGDSVSYNHRSLSQSFGGNIYPSDESRLMRLTDQLLDDDDILVVHRLDRLSLAYSSHSSVIKIGRQAISWGNGLMFNPMDMFNPFDPTAVDTEYKTGDDMLYAQRLFDNGHDLQAVLVGRRDNSGDLSASGNSTAFKYHGFIGEHEFDMLLAQHFDDSVLALGGVWGLGGAIARTDFIVSESDNKNYYSAVANLSYSWVAFERNFSGSLEYFYNGFGLDSGDYHPLTLSQNPQLLKRLARGELFNLARQYLAATMTVELHPLWVLTPTGFWNVKDGSSLFQLVSSHDISQESCFLLSLNLPIGDKGSEFGGLESGIDDRYLSSGPSLLAQLAWYF
ncbi:hypothetical protein [Teredinibacter haidensis]|uniref:hypothetical protein n=1 Tax=Teredinibacter haidensis TaxID=2731755 RepID=UPI0009490EAC|nr:hypothetical protein [Teredinibacter haidensis]